MGIDGLITFPLKVIFKAHYCSTHDVITTSAFENMYHWICGRNIAS